MPGNSGIEPVEAGEAGSPPEKPTVGTHRTVRPNINDISFGIRFMALKWGLLR